MHDIVIEIQQRLVTVIDCSGSEDAKIALLKLKELSEQVIELEADLAMAQMAAQSVS
tara:strand:- start:7455 stop:7625 length:171 start_codon:yes stop_codon:yes gene_type:complete